MGNDYIHYYCDEGTDEDPTPVHRCNQQAPYLPNYVSHEGVDPVAYHLLWKEPSEIVHEACAKTPRDREFPLYAEDIEAMRNLEPITCDVCEKQIAEAITT
jgi:hypothetical protein